jgi:hypothetical protein
MGKPDTLWNSNGEMVNSRSSRITVLEENLHLSAKAWKNDKSQVYSKRERNTA